MKKEVGSADASVLETDFAQLSDGSLVEMIEDPLDATKSKFAVYRDGAVQYVDSLRDGSRTLVPLPRAEAHLKHVCLPSGAEPFGGFTELLGDVASFFKFCLDVDDSSLLLMSAHVLSTWFPEKLPFAPYLALVGPPGSGKTTALRVLALLSRRSILTADITSAAFYDVCDRIRPTILIDETLTAGNARALFHVLRASSSRGFVSLRKGNAQLAYGPKVLSWIELPNDPQLCSRCIIIPMYKTTRTDLRGPDDRHVLKVAEKVRMRLQQFRFERFSGLSLSKIPAAPNLSSRPLDLYRAMAIACSDEPEFCELLASMIAGQMRFQSQLLSPAQTATLRVLYAFIHQNPTCGGVRVRGLANLVSQELVSCAEPSTLSERKLGSVLTSLGLTNRTRQNSGFVLWLDRSVRQRVHKLASDYEVCEAPEQGSEPACDICVEATKATTQNGSKVIPPGDKPAASKTKSERSEHRVRLEDKPKVPAEPEAAGGDRMTVKPIPAHGERNTISDAAAEGAPFPRRGTRQREGGIEAQRDSRTRIRKAGA